LNESWLPLAAAIRTEVLEPIKSRLIGKDEIIEVLGVSLVAGENTFLLGPPGTGKSALVHELAARLNGRSFDYLLTRFTEPSELFGPFDLRRLREGDLVTNTEGMLPEADFVFLDELLNANSAVLNSLLAALNERVFRRGREKTKLPMLIAIGASNRLPGDDALQALFDRFLLRVHCDNVTTDRLGEVLDAGRARDKDPGSPSSISVDAIRQLQSAILEVDLSAARPPLIEVIKQLRQAGMSISDRRAVRLQRVIAASAVVSGRSVAIPSDLWPLRMIWDTPAQIEMLHSHVQNAINKFTTSHNANDQGEHPLAHPERGPDPELLGKSIEALLSITSTTKANDSLSLLAARVEWIQNESAREHLRSKIADARTAIQNSQSDKHA
jgi:MoxR-like ATPase